MSDTSSPERTYQHQVPAEVFIEAFTTPTWTHAQTKKFNALGIVRLKSNELKARGIDTNDWKFDGNDNLTLLSNVEVTEEICIENQSNILPHWCVYQSKLPTINIKNCLWQDRKTETRKLIFYVVNCSAKDVSIENSTMGYFRISNSIIGSFDIKDSKLSNLIAIRSKLNHLNIRHSITNKFVIKTCKTGNVSIEYSKTDYIWVLSKSSTGDFNVSNSTTGNYCIEDSSISNIRVINSITGYYSIERSEIIFFNIKDLCFSGDIRISDSTVVDCSLQNSKTGPLWVRDKSTLTNLNISKCITSDFNIDDSIIEFLHIKDSCASYNFIKANILQGKISDCYILKLQVENECKMQLYVSGGQMNHLAFRKYTSNKDTTLSLYNLKIYICNISEFANLGNLYFRKIQVLPTIITWMTINEFYLDISKNKTDENQKKQITHLLIEQQKEYLKDIDMLYQNFPNATYRISQSSLGKTEFTECDLGDFNFEYNNSKITEIFISGGTLPRNVNIYGETDKLKILAQQKSFFDQLKKVFEGQGDIVRGTKYHALASEKQMEIIEAEKGIWSSEWWVYWLNKKSNKHGESWWQAVKFIVYVSVPIYCFYCFSTPQFSFQGNWDWKLFGDFFGYYFSFLLPTHKVDFIPDVKQNVGTLFFDFFGRIAIGYGIYQLISAFRKHGKKG